MAEIGNISFRDKSYGCRGSIDEISFSAQYLLECGLLGSSLSDFPAASGNGYELQMGRFSRLLAPNFLDLIVLEESGNILDA